MGGNRGHTRLRPVLTRLPRLIACAAAVALLGAPGAAGAQQAPPTPGRWHVALTPVVQYDLDGTLRGTLTRVLDDGTVQTIPMQIRMESGVGFGARAEVETPSGFGVTIGAARAPSPIMHARSTITLTTAHVDATYHVHPRTIMAFNVAVGVGYVRPHTDNPAGLAPGEDYWGVHAGGELEAGILPHLQARAGLGTALVFPSAAVGRWHAQRAAGRYTLVDSDVGPILLPEIHLGLAFRS